jgi:hypothetical protein
MKITEAEVGRNLSETEAEAEGHEVMDRRMSRSSPTSEIYLEVLAEGERRVQIGRPTLGTRNIRR